MNWKLCTSVAFILMLSGCAPQRIPISLIDMPVLDNTKGRVFFFAGRVGHRLKVSSLTNNIEDGVSLLQGPLYKVIENIFETEDGVSLLSDPLFYPDDCTFVDLIPAYYIFKGYTDDWMHNHSFPITSVTVEQGGIYYFEINVKSDGGPGIHYNHRYELTYLNPTIGKNKLDKCYYIKNDVSLTRPY